MSHNKKSSRFGHWLRLALTVIALASSGHILVAQAHPDQQVPLPESQDVKPVALQVQSYSENIALLGTDQRYLDLLTLQTRRRTFFMYGMAVSESYVDSFEESSGGQNSSALLWSPHVAIINASNHSSFSFQYAPSIVQSTSGPSSRQVFHAGTISFGQPIAPNWVLQVSSSNTYGTDSSRLLSPLAFALNKGIPIADSSSAFFEFNRGKVFGTSDNVGLSWQRSPSQVVNFSLGGSYFSSLDAGLSGSSTFAQVSYSAAVSPRTSLNAGGNYYHQIFDLGSCDGYGFSVGISQQVGRHITLSVGGGPEFANASCRSKGLGGNYQITMSFPLSRRSRMGLTAGRSYTTNYLTDTQWSDTGALSYSRQLSEAFDLNLNAGYGRGVRAQSGLGAYVGYFAEADLSWKLTRTLALVTTYRRFEQVSGGPNQGQNVVMLSLGWNPLPIRIVK